MLSLGFYPALLVALITFVTAPARARPSVLLAISAAFYLWWDLRFALILVASTVWTYAWAARVAAAPTDDRRLNALWIAVGPLVTTLFGLRFSLNLLGLVMPVSASYYTLKLIGYLVEVYNDEAALVTDFVRFANYPAFFPQIVAGPIQRSQPFRDQLTRACARPIDLDLMAEGVHDVVAGLALKLLIADRLQAFVRVVDADPTLFATKVTNAMVVCYTLHLFADFAGYSKIAIGIGKLFGITAPPNFNAPFAARDVQDLWRRWHVSLTSWLTDYLFLPLRMTLRGYGTFGLCVAITVNMVAVGVWHGLTRNYLIFGLLHAGFILVTTFARPRCARLFGTTRPAAWTRAGLGMALTFGLFTFSQIFFQTRTPRDAIVRIGLLLNVVPHGRQGWGNVRVDVVDPLHACMAIAFYVGLGAPGFARVAGPIRAYVPRWARTALMLLVISTLSLDSGGAFVYGQF